MNLSSLEEGLGAGDVEGFLFNAGGFGGEGAETVLDCGFLMENGGGDGCVDLILEAMVILSECDPVATGQVTADGGAVVGEAGSTYQALELINLQRGRREVRLVILQVLRVYTANMLDEQTVPELSRAV